MPQTEKEYTLYLHDTPSVDEMQMVIKGDLGPRQPSGVLELSVQVVPELALIVSNLNSALLRLRDHGSTTTSTFSLINSGDGLVSFRILNL